MSETERRLYRLINVVMRVVLRSPLHGLFSGRVMLLNVRGRRTGRTYSVPVSYVRDGESVSCFTGRDWGAWWLNLRGTAAVTAHLEGRELEGTARVVTEKNMVAESLGTFLRRFPATAGRYGVGLAPDGRPGSEDIAVAARSGKAIMIEVQVGREMSSDPA